MIAIVDTGGANIASVTNALDRLGYNYKLTQSKAVIKDAHRVLLPGVGAAHDSMSRLEKADLIGTIKGLKQPVMGICLGMQLLYEASDEGDTPCIGVLPGRVKAMQASKGLTIPHMGWNRLEKLGDSKLLKELPEEAYVYFVHSFQAPNTEFVKAQSLHGTQVPAIVERENFYGCQFHPERSGKVGAQILENFLK